MYFAGPANSLNNGDQNVKNDLQHRSEDFQHCFLRKGRNDSKIYKVCFLNAIPSTNSCKYLHLFLYLQKLLLDLLILGQPYKKLFTSLKILSFLSTCM